MLTRLIVLILASVLAAPLSATAEVVRIKNLKVLCVIYRGDPATRCTWTTTPCSRPGTASSWPGCSTSATASLG